MHHLTRCRLHLTATAALLFPILTIAPSAHAQWELEDSGTTADLRGIHALGAGIAWASGTHGTVLRTEDGGYLWQGCAIPPGAEQLDFRGIQAFDDQTAIVMSSGPGDQSRLYKTTDGCRTWKLLFTNPDKDGFWDALQFNAHQPSPSTSHSAQQGVLIGDPVNGVFAIYETGDSGENWIRWEVSGGAPPANMGHHPAKAATGESLFAASNSALITPGVNAPFAFVTGGLGGAHMFVPEPHSPFDNGTTRKFSVTRLPFTSNMSSGAFSIASRPNGAFNADLIIVGGDYQRPTAPATTVYVPTRNACCFGIFPQKLVRASTPPHGYRSSVAYDSTHNTWITVGPNGTDISTDDGKHWTALHPTCTEPQDADQHWNALSLPFVVGPHGRIGKLRGDALTPAPKPTQPSP